MTETTGVGVQVREGDEVGVVCGVDVGVGVGVDVVVGVGVDVVSGVRVIETGIYRLVVAVSTEGVWEKGSQSRTVGREPVEAAAKT